MAVTPLDPAALLLFASVASEGGIRAGAAKVGLPRSTVSRRLAELERDVGARLVVRTSRRFRVTDLGRALAEQGARIAELLRTSEQLVRRSETEPAGVLRVAVAPLLGEALLPEVLPQYLSRYPDVQVELALAPDYVDLHRADVDLALRSGPLGDATDLFVVRLGTTVSGCYAHPSYLRARGVPKRLGDLASHDAIVVGGNDRAPTWVFRERGGDVSIPVKARVRVNDYRVAGRIAAAGGGIVRLARFHAARLVETKALVPVLQSKWPRVPVFAVHTSVRPAPPKIRAFVELAVQAASRILDA